MNYEEKYKQALERAKYLKENTDSVGALDISANFEYIFPELRKSKDERIRKGLVKGLSAMRDIHHHQTFSDDAINIDDAIAWLEKQGEQKFIDKIQLGKKYKCIASPRYSTFMKGNIYKPEDKFVCSLMNFCSDCFEPIEDNEQESTDKVEPKFKVGNWITNGEYTWKVTDIKPLDYILQSQNGDTVDDTISYVDKEFHLWTIQDAKDGDVLSQDSIPFIFKSWDNNCIAYCGITGFGLFKVVEDYFSWCNGINVTPATKEQRDLLFQKMKEEGYVWYAEKKELKKIYQEYPLTPSKCFKPTWSEEDEEMIDFMIEFIESLYWRKDLTKRKDDVLSWLESIKDMVQPKQEWSEENKKRVDSIISSIEYCSEQYPDRKEYAKDINWLKSLKPNHWKPSEQNIKDLEWCADLVKDKMGVGFHRLQVFIDEIKNL